ncbi:predicted protein [Pyrenophora tritici-repentis Pt-1C-BFP]|uniref:Uncharacterized protein n=1 Tax=Pyrenophora tritici-repentis (strain Pt-1C-BFP) TaxID=426418 RepID=B2W4F5_PYRTR|nr:uncharacterized protein PTRG_04505 [Pyrenophora tritici-repentis Pt-1C-BFP]EDU47412.1 predicted protein [Pyrenophora tritici-repentis Pt-1C-BFP]
MPRVVPGWWMNGEMYAGVAWGRQEGSCWQAQACVGIGDPTSWVGRGFSRIPCLPPVERRNSGARGQNSWNQNQNGDDEQKEEKSAHVVETGGPERVQHMVPSSAVDIAGPISAALLTSPPVMPSPREPSSTPSDILTHFATPSLLGLSAHSILPYPNA